jgi:hypothetical protein
LDTTEPILLRIDGTPCRGGLPGRDTTGTVTLTGGAGWLTGARREGLVATGAVVLGVGVGAAAVGLVGVAVGVVVVVGVIVGVGVGVDVGAVVTGA